MPCESKEHPSNVPDDHAAVVMAVKFFISYCERYAKRKTHVDLNQEKTKAMNNFKRELGVRCKVNGKKK